MKYLWRRGNAAPSQTDSPQSLSSDRQDAYFEALLRVPTYLQAMSLIQMTKMGSMPGCDSLQPGYVATLPDAADDPCMIVGGAALLDPAEARLA